MSANLAWQRWFHCTGSTYGTWLPGDPRGWRSVHHKVHVEGDYRSPPPQGAHRAIHLRSQSLRKHPALVLAPQYRQVACDAWAQALSHHQVAVAAIAVGGMHWHLLGQFLDCEPRQIVGRAKTWSQRQLINAGLKREGPVWAKKCQYLPISDERHFENAAAYISNHVKDGAAVWLAQGGQGS